MSETTEKKQEKTIFYHSHPDQKKKERTHTICIYRNNEELFVTWAKPLPGYDIFSRKVGILISEGKMKKLVGVTPDKVIPCVANGKLTKAQLFEYLPAQVASTLPWYISKASKYYGGEPKVVSILCKNKGQRAVIRGEIADYVSLV